MSQYTFVVGADDPELQLICRILTERGYAVVQAFADGVPVNSSNAYRADEFLPALPVDGSKLVWVECGPANPEIVREIVVDHHREGDPGYDLGPDAFWMGSSLGQVCTLIGVAQTKELLLAAASDHCLSAAYRGECPGIHPNELRSWRVGWRALRHGLKKYQLVSRINKAISALEEMETIMFHGTPVVNAMNVAIPELREAAAIQGKAMLYGYMDRDTDMTKIGLFGARPEVIAEWMRVIGQSTQVVQVYGNPKRGYAGAYIPATSGLATC